MKNGVYPGKRRAHQHEPIVPAVEGKTPAWVVSCLDCPWSHDAHGIDASDAIASLAGAHQRGHRLIAQSIDYDTGWPRPGQPLAGIGPSVGGHGLYHK